MAWVGTVHSNHAGAAGCIRRWLFERPHRHLHRRGQRQCDAPRGVDRRDCSGPTDLDRHPSGRRRPSFVLDIATTVTSHGTIKVLAQAGEQMPEGWVVDLRAIPSSTQPRRRGLPDADRGLQGVRSQHRPRLARRGPQRRRVRGRGDRSPQGAGASGQHRSGDVRDAPDLFMDLDDFVPIDHHLDSLRAPGIRARSSPGDMAARLEEEQSAEGIPVGEVLLGQLRDLGARLELDDRLD